MLDKKSWQSKTIWGNLILAIVPLIPGADAYLSAHPQVMASAFAVINIILRLISNGKVELL